MTAVPTLPPDFLKSPQAVITWARSGWDRLVDDLPLIPSGNGTSGPPGRRKR